MHPNILAIGKLTKRFLFSLEKGLYILGSSSGENYTVDDSLLYPEAFEEHVVPVEEREAQWQRAKANGNAYRTVAVFSSQGDRCLWQEDFVRKNKHRLSSGCYRARYGRGMLVESITYEGGYDWVRTRFTEVDDPRGLSFPVDDRQLIRVLQGASNRLIYVQQGVEYVLEDQYALIGYYWDGDNTARPNVEIIDSSREYKDLERVQRAISEVNRIMHEEDCSWDEPPQAVLDIIDWDLPHINIWDHWTDYVQKIHLLGIYYFKSPVHRADI